MQQHLQGREHPQSRGPQQGQQPTEEPRQQSPQPQHSQQALQLEQRPSAFRERRDRVMDSVLSASRRASAQAASFVNTARKRLSGWSQPSLGRLNEGAVYGTCVAGAALVVLVALALIARAGVRGASGLASAAGDVGGEPHSVEHVPALQEQPCSSPSCNQVSRTLLLSLSHETSPCANFYEYVCEGWKRRHPLRDDKYQVSVLTEAEREVRKRLMLALETSAIPRRNQSQIDKVVALYRSCVGSLSRGGQSLHDLRAFFRLHNSRWPEPYAPERPEFFDHLLELDIRWNLAIAFRYRFAPADDRAGGRTVVLQPVVPDASVLGPATRRAYQSLIATVATLLGGEANYVDLVDTVVSVDSVLVRQPADDTRLAVPWTRIYTVLPGTTYQMWLRPFTKYHPLGGTVHGLDPVQVHSPRYFNSLLTVLLENVANGRSSWYVGWRLVLTLACQTSHEFRSLRQTKFLWPRGQCGALDVHTHCRALAQRLLRPQWQGFVTKVLLSPDAVFEVLGIVKRIRSTLEERLRQATWMDPETRVRAFTKLEALREQLPKFFVFDGRTPEYERYARLPDLTPSFLENWLAFRHALGPGVDPPLTANGSLSSSSSGGVRGETDEEDLLRFEVAYEAAANELRLNVDVLARPVYSRGAPAPVNFGALGAIVGRELTRAFDRQGALVDAVGKPNLWWSPETQRKYEMRERCFLGQLTRHVNDSAAAGKLLRRIVTVSSGLRLAFFAHKAHELESGRRETLRDVTALSGDQLLFASFCYAHCHSVGKLGEVLDLRFGRRTLGELLCNVAVTNMLEFSEAFGCADDAKMAAAVKCRIW
ncbi:neprilysin-1-like [Dermacentor andersoni]|uniref:neprilysin-1-like n=1 Tax=Dermacentor andersoni TaxID=34620 RepID=UPI003B3A769D